jgi:hypothetical protein
MSYTFLSFTRFGVFLFEKLNDAVINLITMIGAAASSRRSSRLQQEARRRQPQIDSPSDSDFDVSSYLNDIHLLEKNVSRSTTEAKALLALDVTKKHHTRQHRLVRSFLDIVSRVVTTDGTPKWGSMMESVPNPLYNLNMRDDLKQVPKCFVVLAGPATFEKKKLVNAMVVDWQLNLKKVKTKAGECPYYQCEVQNTEFRSFVSHMAKNHGWTYLPSDFANFEGSLNAVMKTIYKKRFEEWASGRICFTLHKLIKHLHN